MVRRRIFSKNKIKFKSIFIFFTIIIFSVLFYINYFYEKEIFFIIDFNKEYYIIPKNKEGIEVPNTDIDVLHSNNTDNISEQEKIANIEYSIQLFSSTDFFKVDQKLNYYLKNRTINSNDLFIVLFENSLKTDEMYKDSEDSDSPFKKLATQ